jgi:23S rRNA pseudouridine2605 synthase
VYYLLNKPAGVVSTAKDTHDRETVVELVPAEPRVYPVGRLDAETEGLLLLTNDGDLTHRLTHPKFGVEKEYIAHVDSGGRAVSNSALTSLRKGVDIGDGVTSPAEVGELQPGVLRIVIHEGRNRQVRRMCDAVGYPVLRLARTRIGPLVDKTLRPGDWRELTLAEVRSLIEAVAGEPTDTM